MSSGDEEEEVGEGWGFLWRGFGEGGEDGGEGVSFEVVRGNEGDVLGEREGFGGGGTDDEASQQSRSAGCGDVGDVGEGVVALCEGLCDEGL